MHRHDTDQDEQSERVGKAVGHRVDADQRQHEQIAREQEVEDHPLVPEVVVQAPAEQIGVVEEPEREHEVGRGEERIGDDLRKRRVEGPEDPLAATARAVIPLADRPERERDRSARHKQQRNPHRQRHVPEHVHAEEVLLIDVVRAVGDPGKRGKSGKEQDGAVDGPPVAASAKAPDTREIEERGEGTPQRPQQVDLPR